MQRIALAKFVASLFFLASSTASLADPSDLQSLGARIKFALDQAVAGSMPADSQLRDLRQQLDAVRDSTPTRDASAVRKLYSVERLLGDLLAVARGMAPPNPQRSSHVMLDRQIVGDAHGGDCAHALGLSAMLPVQVTLAQAGSAGSSAWFRFEPGRAGSVRFTTDSEGADPSIAVFPACSHGAVSVASEDDGVGLDAAVTWAARDREPLFVRVDNTGSGGNVILSANDVMAISVSGKVTDAVSGQPIPLAYVGLVAANGYTAAQTSTDLLGNYIAQPGSAGTYYLYATATQHIDQLYPNAPCAYGYNFYLPKCNLAAAQVLDVSDGTALSGINVVLARGQRISGVVHATGSGAPIAAIVELHADDGALLDQTSTDAVGAWQFSTLPPATYRVLAKSGAYGSQMSNHVACAGPLQIECDLGLATPIPVSNADIGGLDFDLPLLGSVRGRVTGDGGLPIVGSVTIYVLDQYGNQVAFGSPDAVGRYSAGPLGVGSYFVYASSYAGYFSQIFNGVDCAASCINSAGAASMISVASLGDTATADFSLHPLPTVTGHATDSVTGYPLANVQVFAATTLSAFYSPSATTDSFGNYSLPGLPAGKYYLWARSTDHVDQVYSGVPCEAYDYNYSVTFNCDIVGASLLTIAPNVPLPSFDFVLDRSASISGSATVDAGVSTHLPANVTITVYNGSGTALASTTADATGHFRINDLAPGTYFATAAGNYGTGYISQVWSHQNCDGSCLPPTGTPIVVATGAAVEGIDFSLVPLNAIVGRVTNKDGMPLPGSYVDLFSAATHEHIGSGVADSDGYYVLPANPGTGYNVATDAIAGYYNQVFSGISCPIGPAYFGQCALTGATTVSLLGGSVPPVIMNFVLQSSDPIFKSGFENLP